MENVNISISKLQQPKFTYNDSTKKKYMRMNCNNVLRFQDAVDDVSIAVLNKNDNRFTVENASICPLVDEYGKIANYRYKLVAAEYVPVGDWMLCLSAYDVDEDGIQKPMDVKKGGKEACKIKFKVFTPHQFTQACDLGLLDEALCVTEVCDWQ